MNRPRQLRALSHAARELGVDPPVLLDLIRAGRVAAWRIGDSVHVDVVEIADLLGRPVSSSSAAEPDSPRFEMRRRERSDVRAFSLPVTPAMKAAVVKLAKRALQHPQDWVVGVLARHAAEAPRARPYRRRMSLRGAGALWTAHISVPLDPVLRGACENAASAAELSLAAWMRSVILAQTPAEVGEDMRARLDTLAPRLAAPVTSAGLRTSVTTHVASDTRRRWQQAAAGNGLPLSGWSRRALIHALANTGPLPPDTHHGRLTVTIRCTPDERQALTTLAARHRIAREALVRRLLAAAATRSG